MLSILLTGATPYAVQDEWVAGRISHVTYMNETCHAYEWVTSHTWMGNVTCINELHHTFKVHVPSRQYNTRLNSRHTNYLNESRMRPVTYMNVSHHTLKWHLVFETIRDNTRLNSRHTNYLNESRHAWPGWVTSHIFHDSCHTYEWVTSRIWMCHITHWNDTWSSIQYATELKGQE